MSYIFEMWVVEGEIKPSKLREFRNLVETLEGMNIREDLEGHEIFLSANNTVSDSIAAKGSSTSDVLYDLIVMVFNLGIQYCCSVKFVHMAGTRMIQQGMDGLRDN